MAASPPIQVRGLVKSYGSFQAVRGIDFDVHAGEVFALLGPNGAGKTTTVEVLEGLRPRDGGDVTVLGFDPGEQPRLGLMVALQDRELGVHNLTGTETFPYATDPTLWAILELVDSS